MNARPTMYDLIRVECDDPDGKLIRAEDFDEDVHTLLDDEAEAEDQGPEFASPAAEALFKEAGLEAEQLGEPSSRNGHTKGDVEKAIDAAAEG